MKNDNKDISQTQIESGDFLYNLIELFCKKEEKTYLCVEYIDSIIKIGSYKKLYKNKYKWEYYENLQFSVSGIANSKKDAILKIKLKFKKNKFKNKTESKDLPNFKKETAEILDLKVRKSADPYVRKAALDIAFAVSKNKLPSSISSALLKADPSTMSVLLEKIEKERPVDICKWLMMNVDMIMNPPKET